MTEQDRKKEMAGNSDVQMVLVCENLQLDKNSGTGSKTGRKTD